IQGTSWERVLLMVKELGGDHYLTGHGALSYLNHERFNETGIAVSYMDYNPLPWTQSHGDFSPYVTGLDLLAAEGTSAHRHLRPACIDWQEFKRRRESMQ
ncbi:MAG: WbqC family protein, partial [Paracoccaceae bacterium]